MPLVWVSRWRTVTSKLASGSATRNSGSQVTSGSSSVSRPCSTSRMITEAVSTVVLQFEAEGKLSLDDTVEKWLPGVVPNGADITLRELLNHTSGIPNYIDLPFFVELLHNP